MFQKNTRILSPTFLKLFLHPRKSVSIPYKHIGNRYLICHKIPYINRSRFTRYCRHNESNSHKNSAFGCLISLFYIHDQKNEISNLFIEIFKFLCSSMQVCFLYVTIYPFSTFFYPCYLSVLYEQHLFSHVTVRYNAKYRL